MYAVGPSLIVAGPDDAHVTNTITIDVGCLVGSRLARVGRAGEAVDASVGQQDNELIIVAGRGASVVAKSEHGWDPAGADFAPCAPDDGRIGVPVAPGRWRGWPGRGRGRRRFRRRCRGLGWVEASVPRGPAEGREERFIDDACACQTLRRLGRSDRRFGLAVEESRGVDVGAVRVQRLLKDHDGRAVITPSQRASLDGAIKHWGDDDGTDGCGHEQFSDWSNPLLRKAVAENA